MILDSSLMKRKQILLSTIIFIFISLIFIAIGRQTSLLEDSVGTIFFPLGRIIHSTITQRSRDSLSTQIQNLQSQILEKAIEIKKLKSENTDLRSQFAYSNLSAQTLLPSRIVNITGSFGSPTGFILDRGQSDGVKINQGVVYDNTAIGKITKISAHFSQVSPITDQNVSIPAQTLNTSSLGIIKGQGEGGIILDNVILSDHLQIGDTAVVKGTQDLSGTGFPPGVIIGKITQISRFPSSLFQKAGVKPPFKISNLTTVFIILGNK